MSTAPSNPHRADPRPAAFVLALALLAALPALANQNDRQQPIHVSASHFQTAQDSGITTLSGDVVITQGTLKATAAQGVAHANAAGRTERIVLHGQPAHLQQRLDDGSLMQAHADVIDYQVNGETITLTGNAHVHQPGQGSFDGARLVYDPATGAIEGSGGKDGRVHLILAPRATDSD